MRLIDADALKQRFRNNENSTKDEMLWNQAVRRMIEEQPTVDAVPVVRGKWIPVEDRLPEGCDDAEIEVLISTKEEYPDVLFEEAGFALYYPGTKQFHSVYGDRLDITEIVTAWQHLPAPYDMRKKVEE